MAEISNHDAFLKELNEIVPKGNIEALSDSFKTDQEKAKEVVQKLLNIHDRLNAILKSDNLSDILKEAVQTQIRDVDRRMDLIQGALQRAFGDVIAKQIMTDSDAKFRNIVRTVATATAEMPAVVDEENDVDEKDGKIKSILKRIAAGRG